MKKKLFCKKQKNTRQGLVLIQGLALLFSLLFLLIPIFSHAQNAADIQNKINQNNSNIQSLEQEIATYQTQLDALGATKKFAEQVL